MLVAGGGVAGLAATAAFAAAGFRSSASTRCRRSPRREAEGSDLRSTAFLLPAVDAPASAPGSGSGSAPQAAPLRVMRIADAGGAEGVIREMADFEREEIGAEVFG